MNKLFFMAALACMPLIGHAQNTWEEPEANEQGVRVNPDQKYLEGAVTTEEGRVVFRTTLKAPGKTAAQIYETLLSELTRMTKEEGQFEQSRVTISDKDSHSLSGSYQEWLVFKKTALVLDRTRFMYTISAECKDGEAEVTMSRLYYFYEEERDPQTLKAEDVITDEYGLKKDKQKLSRVYGKFRRKTIDRKDYIFNKFNKLLQ